MFGLSKSVDHIPEFKTDPVLFFHEDYSADEVNEALVGRKGRSLFQLKEMDVPVPDFFVLSPALFKRFFVGALSKQIETFSKDIKSVTPDKLEKVINSYQFEQDVLDQISQAYSRLSGFSSSWVAVRSSVSYLGPNELSFSGVFDTALNVRGINELLSAIKKVYLSILGETSVAYALTHGLNLAEVQLGVVVQKMVQPEVSGVAYTVDPVTNDLSKISVEAVFGLGDVISEGLLKPDQYILEKKTLAVTEKHIAPQEWMRVRGVSTQSGKGSEYERVQISSAWSHQQKLEDKNVSQVAKISLIVEDRSGVPQAIEWTWESGNVWILQSKSIASLTAGDGAFNSEPLTDEAIVSAALSILKEKKEEEHAIKEEIVEAGVQLEPVDAQDPVEVENSALEDATEGFMERQQERKLAESILTAALGKPAQPSTMDTLSTATEQIASMTPAQTDNMMRKEEKEISVLSRLSDRLRRLSAKSIESAMEKQEKSSQKDREQISTQFLTSNQKLEFVLTGIGASQGEAIGKVIYAGSLNDSSVLTKDQLLVTKGFKPELEKFIPQVGGVVMDEGGLTSDVSMLCRESGTPAIVGTGLATALLKEGEMIKIDGSVGSIYRFITPTESPAEVKPSAKVKAEKTPDPKSVEPVKPSKIPTASKAYVTPDVTKGAQKQVVDLKLADGIGIIELDQLMLAEKRHPMAFAQDGNFKGYAKDIEVTLDQFADGIDGDEMLVGLGSATTGQYRELTKSSEFEGKDDEQVSQFGLQRLLGRTKLFEKQLGIVKRSRTIYKNRNISLVLHSPINGEMVREAKKILSALGLKRTGTFNLYISIDRPSEIILLEEILSAGIDGVIINTPLLARQLQGLPMLGGNVKYDLAVNSVIKLIESVMSQLRGQKVRTLVVVEDSLPLTRKAIELGCYGVISTPEALDGVKKSISDVESKLVMRI